MLVGVSDLAYNIVSKRRGNGHVVPGQCRSMYKNGRGIRSEALQSRPSLNRVEEALSLGKTGATARTSGPFYVENAVQRDPQLGPPAPEYVVKLAP